MNGRLVTSTVAVLVLAAFAYGSASLAASRSASTVITGTRSIGGYRVGAAYVAAQRVLGGPYSSSQDRVSCTARWSRGVTIAWRRTLPYSKWSKACVKFKWANVGRSRIPGETWRTDKGLRVGATVSQLKKLYPNATRKSSSGYVVWRLAKGSKFSLQAWVRSGRVAFFRLATA